MITSSKVLIWIDCDNLDQSINSFIHRGKDLNDFLIIICNFALTSYGIYKVGVPKLVDYVEAFYSDNDKFGDRGKTNNIIISPVLEIGMDNLII